MLRCCGQCERIVEVALDFGCLCLGSAAIGDQVKVGVSPHDLIALS